MEVQNINRLRFLRPSSLCAGRNRRGFSLMEVLTALAIIAVLTAVALPALNGKLQDSRAAALEQTFNGISQAIAEFKRATTNYPSTLSMLNTAPAATDKNICNNQFGSTVVSLWRGPYLSREITSSGIQMGDGLIQNNLSNTLNASSTYAVLIKVTATGVESSTVGDLEADLDGNNDLSAGTIRATVNASTTSVYDVVYAIPVSSC